MRCDKTWHTDYKCKKLSPEDSTRQNKAEGRAHTQRTCRPARRERTRYRCTEAGEGANTKAQTVELTTMPSRCRARLKYFRDSVAVRCILFKRSQKGVTRETGWNTSLHFQFELHGSRSDAPRQRAQTESVQQRNGRRNLSGGHIMNFV